MLPQRYAMETCKAGWTASTVLQLRTGGGDLLIFRILLIYHKHRIGDLVVIELPFLK
jgi:hypothetical protein